MKVSSSRNKGTNSSGSGVVGLTVVSVSIGGCVVSLILVLFWLDPTSLFRRRVKLDAVSHVVFIAKIGQFKTRSCQQIILDSNVRYSLN